MSNWIDRRAEEIREEAMEKMESGFEYAEQANILEYVLTNAEDIAKEDYEEECELARGRMVRDLFKKW